MSDLTLPFVSAGALLASAPHPEHLREHLSHDAAGSGDMGPVCSVDADRYVRLWVLLQQTASQEPPLPGLCRATYSFPCLSWMVNVLEPPLFLIE